MARQDIRARVRRVAEQVLAEQHYVRPIDILLGLGWLAPSHLDQWQQGRTPYLERTVQANLNKISTATAELRRWARERGLIASETTYTARTRDRRALRFSASNDPSIEKAYRTHWVSPELPEQRSKRLSERLNRPPGPARDREQQTVELRTVRSRVRNRRVLDDDRAKAAEHPCPQWWCGGAAPASDTNARAYSPQPTRSNRPDRGSTTELGCASAPVTSAVT